MGGLPTINICLIYCCFINIILEFPTNTVDILWIQVADLLNPTWDPSVDVYDVYDVPYDV